MEKRQSISLPIILCLIITLCLYQLWFRVVHLFIIFMEEAKFQEVNAWLEKFWITKFVQIDNKFSLRSVHIINILYYYI